MVRLSPPGGNGVAKTLSGQQGHGLPTKLGPKSARKRHRSSPHTQDASPAPTIPTARGPALGVVLFLHRFLFRAVPCNGARQDKSRPQDRPQPAQNLQTPGARPHTASTHPRPLAEAADPRAIPMAKGGGEGREGNALKTVVIVAGGLALAWVTVETAFRPFLDRLRAAVSRSTDPSRDPDQDSAPAPAAPPTPAAAAEEVEEKAPAPTAAEPSAPPLPVEEGEKVAE
jgi:hypothetical protein